jgi:hypothetical protein
VPAVQLVHWPAPVMVEWAKVPALDEEYDPAEQTVHSEAPAAEYIPAAQTSQRAPANAPLKVPARQARQLEDPTVA